MCNLLAQLSSFHPRADRHPYLLLPPPGLRCLPPPKVAYVISICALPSEFTGLFAEEPERAVKNW